MVETTGHLSLENPHCMNVTWKIPDFFRKPAKEDCCLASPSFALAEAVWQIALYPNGRTWEKSEGYIEMFLKRLKSSVPEQNATVRFCLVCHRGKEHKGFSTKGLFKESDGSWGVKKFIERRKIRKDKHFISSDGALTVQCRIIVELSSPEGELPGTHFTVNKQIKTDFSACKRRHAFSQTDMPDAFKKSEAVPATSSNADKLQSDQKKRVKSEEKADGCLKVSDKEFQNHKCLLKAQSSVFSAMLKHDQGKKNSSEDLDIRDLDQESFPNFLRLVYARSVAAISEKNVLDFYAAAEKFNMKDLKSECKNYMVKTLSVDTFCDVLILAVRYREEDLLKSAVDFFAKNFTAIILTLKWLKFSEEYDAVANELLDNALEPRQGK